MCVYIYAIFEGPGGNRGGVVLVWRVRWRDDGAYNGVDHLWFVIKFKVKTYYSSIVKSSFINFLE